jgi:hypothetical protein
VRSLAGGALGLLLALGCRTGDRPSGNKDSSTSSLAAGAGVPGVLVRASTVADSSVAAAVVDSLVREGWEASTARRASESGEWPVNVLVPGDTTLARLIVRALSTAGLDAEIIGTRPGQRTLAVSVTPVNRGTHGMSARVRWTSSPDRRAFLVIEDPRGVENDPVPNGFVFASEGVSLVQRDSVWDVAPSPDWRRVAYARAYTTTPGESDSIPPREWHRLAGLVGLTESDVRKNAFPTSSMVTAFGSARPVVVDLTYARDTTPPQVTALPIPEGWRLAWTLDGTRLAIGAPPAMIADDGQASRWRLVDPADGSSHGPADPVSLQRLQWTEGPNIDISTAVDMKQRRAFRSGELDVESEDGWIRVYAHDGSRVRAPRIVGPGIALMATANGQFIVAIAADPNAQAYDPPHHLVVYQILHR